MVTGILPHLVTESNNNLRLGGGALNYAMQNFFECNAKVLTKGRIYAIRRTFRV